MKVLKRSGASAGEYHAVYHQLIKPGNKVGLATTKGGKRLMFQLISADSDDKGGKPTEIAASVLWDPNDERAVSTLGALGVPADNLFKVARVKGDDTAIMWFDKQAREAAEYGIQVNAYVRENGGFASGLRPIDGKFEVEFLRIKTRKDGDPERQGSGTPYWEFIPSKKVTRDGKKWDSDPMNRFWAQFIVVSGKRKGAVIDKMMHYPMVRDEEDEWVFDGTGKGSELYDLLMLNNVDPDKFRPDKHFADPANGLPEIEKLLLKRKHPMGLEVKGGWANKLTPPKGAGAIDTGNAVDVGSDDDDLRARLVAMVEKRVRAEYDKPAWLSSGAISKSGLAWMKKKLPKTLAKLDIDPHLTKLTAKQSEALIGVIRTKYPLAAK